MRVFARAAIDMMIGLCIAVMLIVAGCGGGGEITASQANSAPVANAGTDKLTRAGHPVSLDGSLSSDADGDSLTYIWSFTSKPAGSSTTLSMPSIINPTFTPDVAGSYVLSLKVNDGKSDSTLANITIKAVWDLSLLFNITVSSPINTIGYYPFGSQFSSHITNISSETFELTKYELKNGSTVISSFTDSTSLNNNRLAPGESVDVVITLRLGAVNHGFVSYYWFTDPVTKSNFHVRASYL